VISARPGTDARILVESPFRRRLLVSVIAEQFRLTKYFSTPFQSERRSDSSKTEQGLSIVGALKALDLA
jgi:hypothetical protein